MKKILLIILLALVLLPFQTQAICEGPLVPCGLSEDSPNTPGINERDRCTLCHLFALLDNILRFIITCLVPIVSVLMFTIAGVMFIISRGTIVKKQVTFFTQAKSILTAVITGLVIIFVSWVFLNLFLSAIGVATWTGLGSWWEINCEEGSPPPSPSPPSPSPPPPPPSPPPPPPSPPPPPPSPPPGGGGGACLAENTLILTPEGYKKIQDLNVGNKVIGFDIEKDERVETKVTRKSIHQGQFSAWVYRGVTFTWNHKIYLNNEWKEVKDLAESQKIYEGWVYNVETETQNYFGRSGISDTEILIHNMKVP